MSKGAIITGVVAALVIAVVVYGYSEGWFTQHVSVTVDTKTPPAATPPAATPPVASGNTGIVPPASTPAPIAPPAAPKTQWMFYQGLDSGDNDIHGIPFPGTLASIKQKCLDTPSCLGFNDNGWIKYSIRPKSQWYGWTGNPAQGFRINVDRYPLFPAGGVPEYS